MTTKSWRRQTTPSQVQAVQTKTQGQGPLVIDETNMEKAGEIIRQLGAVQTAAFHRIMTQNQALLPDEIRNDESVQQFINTGKLPGIG